MVFDLIFQLRQFARAKQTPRLGRRQTHHLRQGHLKIRQRHGKRHRLLKGCGGFGTVFIAQDVRVENKGAHIRALGQTFITAFIWRHSSPS